MGKKYRLLSDKNKYSLPKEDYLTSIHYSLRYPLWVEELRTAADTVEAIRYDKDKVQTSISGSTTEDVAIRMSELQNKIDLVDETISEAAGSILAPYLRYSVCHGLTYEQCCAKGLCYGRRQFYEMRRRYIYLLSRKI